MSNLETRLKKIEQAAALNKRDTKVEIYILSDTDNIDYWGDKIPPISSKDIVINVSVNDYDEY